MNIGENIPWGQNQLNDKFNQPNDVVNLIVQNSFIVAGTLLLLLLIFGGFSFILGAGQSDPKQAEKGKKAITSSLIGFAVVLLAYTIIQLIEFITGLDILNPQI